MRVALLIVVLSGCGRELESGQDAALDGVMVSAYQTGSGFNVDTASGLHLSYNLETGRWSLTNASGTTVIDQAYAAANVGLSATTPYHVVDYTAGGASLGTQHGSITLTVAPGSAMLVAVTP